MCSFYKNGNDFKYSNPEIEQKESFANEESSGGKKE